MLNLIRGCLHSPRVLKPVPDYMKKLIEMRGSEFPTGHLQRNVPGLADG